LTRFAALQIPYSLVERTVERDLLPMARQLELAVTTWSPLADGLLAGGYGRDRLQPTTTRIAGVAAYRLNERNLAIADRLNEVAAARGASSAQTAIAWIRAQRRRGVLIPIVGARTPAQLEENLASLELDLTPQELERLDEASRIELGFPHDFGATRLAYGDTRDLIDDHRYPEGDHR
jgi:aryl-alcohol dehydrogenase-like predicted oxidoreductase